MVKIPWLMACARMMMLSYARIRFPLVGQIYMYYTIDEDSAIGKSLEDPHLFFREGILDSLEDDDAAVGRPAYSINIQALSLHY